MLNENEQKLVWILGIVIVIGVLLFQDTFLSLHTLVVLGHQLPEYGLIALSLMITLVVAGVNLSVVATATLSGVVGALFMQQLTAYGWMGILLGLFVMVMVGALAGMVNGWIVSYLEVSPILGSLGTMLFFQGLALNITKGGAVTGFDTNFTQIGTRLWLGIPFPMIVFLVLFAGAYEMIHRRNFGKQVYQIGKSKESARYSGIPVKRVIVLAYGLAGAVLGVSAVLMTARYNSIRVDYGATYLITGMVVVSLAGVRFEGGKGSVISVFLALIIVSLLIRIMNLALMDSNMMQGVMGLFLMGTIIAQHIEKHWLIKKRSDG